MAFFKVHEFAQLVIVEKNFEDCFLFVGFSITDLFYG
jgi:hypothetical protein